MTTQIWIPKSQIVALPETMDALEAAMLEPLGVAIHAVDLAKPRSLEPGALGAAFRCDRQPPHFFRTDNV
jgi:L-iditol 2-dehydrogenase